MNGPKLNEGATVIGERSGTKATAKHVRSSARKARVVLDLIRGLDVKKADEVLAFTERGIARDVRKVLASAVANAVNNDGQDPDELFVIACFADEGPTMRRFRPRARGRASRIRKRTCHITVIVARMSEDRIQVVQARQARVSTGGRPAPSRRARVERSRQRAAEATEQIDAVEAAEVAEELAQDADEVVDDIAESGDENLNETTVADSEASAEESGEDAADETADEPADEKDK
jgi:large subunit ribosomal protein L22